MKRIPTSDLTWLTGRKCFNTSYTHEPDAINGHHHDQKLAQQQQLQQQQQAQQTQIDWKPDTNGVIQTTVPVTKLMQNGNHRHMAIDGD
ncbi:hypothetical protein quinque_013091 [Culex quinquefasciatus]